MLAGVWTPSSLVREGEGEREREREREKGKEKERGREKQRQREEERDREIDVEYVQNCYFYFKRNDRCLGTFYLSSIEITAVRGRQFNHLICILSMVRIQIVYCVLMEQSNFKNVNNSLNTNISFWLETSVGQSSNQYLNVVHFFNSTVYQTSATAEVSCFHAFVSHMCIPIIVSICLFIV